MDLSTTYMGMTLKSPLVISAGPLSKEISRIRKLEDLGASAVIMHSIFEEQLKYEAEELGHFLSSGTESYAEALSYFPEADEYSLGPEEYLEHVAQAKAAVDIPIIGSINGVSAGGWGDYARQIEQASADAVELNVYFVATDPAWSAADVEHVYIDVLQAVKRSVKIPVAIKVSPFFSAMAAMARRLDDAGADALVLFNRFVEPEIDLENLELSPKMMLTGPYEIRLPMRWIAILHGKVKASLAATRAIYTHEDVLKMLMVGADVTMLCSALLKNGIDHLATIEAGMREWMDEHEYDSVTLMKGSMSQVSCPEPATFERAHYMKTLQSYV